MVPCVARALQFVTCVKLLRAGAAGIFATAIDLLVLAVLVTGFHVSPQIANLPALVAGGVANFAGNRWFAFRAHGGSLPKQALGYTVVELVALALNGWLFALVMHVLPARAVWARATRDDQRRLPRVELSAVDARLPSTSCDVTSRLRRIRQRGGRPELSSS